MAKTQIHSIDGSPIFEFGESESNMITGLRKWFKWYPDRFRLDMHRVVYIDGHPFIITGFSADSSYANLTSLSVSFMPEKDFDKKYKLDT